VYNLIKLKPPFSGRKESDITDKIKNGRYERIGKGLDYSDALIDLVERMMSVVCIYLFFNLLIYFYFYFSLYSMY
jgi:hypothetical protein